MTALRELALLWLADRVDEGLERYRAEQGINETWAARTRIVVALTGGVEGETLLRRGALISGRSAGRALIAVHIVRGDGTVGASADVVARLRQLTEDLGGTFHTVVGDDVASAVLEFARSVNGSQVVVGASRRGRLSRVLRPSTVDDIVRESGDIDVHVVTHERAGSRRVHVGANRRRTTQRGILAWTLAPIIPCILTVALLPFADSLNLSTILLAFLLGVVASSLVGGLLPAVVTALVAGLLVNHEFVQPVGSFTIAEPQNAFAILAFVLVAAVIATIVDRSAMLALEASQRRAEANVLASLSVGVLGRANGVRALLEQACETFGMRSAALFETQQSGDISVIEVAGEFPPLSIDEADVAVDAGPGLTMALSGKPLPVTDRRMLDAFAAQAAAVLDRNRLAALAGDAARLQESDAMRTALLTAVSHDLRTPLAVIMLSLATLRDQTLQLPDADRQALLEDAESAASRLDALLANLLDLSRLQTGSVRPIVDQVSLDEVLHQALRGVADDSVIDETDEGLPLIATDPGLLERAVANLVENAVQHSPRLTPVRLCAAVIPGEFLQLRIVDQGPGVAQHDRERMFEPFQRLGDAPAGSGVGLGLAVARGLAEAVGARLEAEDTPGGGLTMVVSIPLATSHAETTS